MPFQDGDKFLMYVVDKVSVESVENMAVKYLGVKHPEIQTISAGKVSRPIRFLKIRCNSDAIPRL